MLQRRTVYSQAPGRLYRELCTRLRVNPAGLSVLDGSFLRATQTVEVKFISGKSRTYYIFSHFSSFMMVLDNFIVWGISLIEGLGFELGS